MIACSKSHASCTTTGANEVTYQYTAATILSPASITFTGTWSCKGDSKPQKLGISRNICSKLMFDGQTSTSNGHYLNYIVSDLSIGGLQQSKVSSNTWYGPALTSANNNVLNYSVKVTLPNSFSQLSTLASGTYTGSLTMYMDMQDYGAPCEGDSGGGWDSGNKRLNFSYVIPALCQFNSTDSIDFGNISDVGKTKQNYDADGAIYTTCNAGTPYSIFLSDGNNRIQDSFRQMNANGEFLAYQLYKDIARTQVWESMTKKQPNGEVKATGTGLRQKTIVYGRIPLGTSVPTPGNYSDTVIVNIVY